MNWRVRLADWISGGKVSDGVKSKMLVSLLEVTIDTQRATMDRFENELAATSDEAMRFYLSLSAIADQEKPTSNSTVKRMARIANEALGRG